MINLSYQEKEIYLREYKFNIQISIIFKNNNLDFNKKYINPGLMNN